MVAAALRQALIQSHRRSASQTLYHVADQSRCKWLGSSSTRARSTHQSAPYCSKPTTSGSCGTATYSPRSHHWAREIAAFGHAVKMMSPAYVKYYVKRGRTDAEAICDAVIRPTVRFVPTKTVEQQPVIMLHKVRDLLIKQRTMLINALRSHLARFGIVSAQGPAGSRPRSCPCTRCRISGPNRRAPPYMASSISYATSSGRSRRLEPDSRPGIERMKSAADLPRCPALGRS